MSACRLKSVADRHHSGSDSRETTRTRHIPIANFLSDLRDYPVTPDSAGGHRQKRMTNTSWWSKYYALASHVLLGRRKGCSGSNLLSYFFYWLSLLSQPCLSPRRRVDGTVSPGQGEAAVIVRRRLLMERMGTYMGPVTTGIQVNPKPRKCGPRLQNPRTNLQNQNQAINRQ